MSKVASQFGLAAAIKIALAHLPSSFKNGFENSLSASDEQL